MQLALNLNLSSQPSFQNFVIGSNGLVLDVIKKMIDGLGELSCFIVSEKGEGLTHLLQAACVSAIEQGKTSFYLPLKEHASLSVALLRDLDNIALICLDDIDVIAGNLLWEEALFCLFNECRDKGHRLLIGAHHLPEFCQFQLPDLQSRLSWGGSYCLAPLNDEEKIALLQKLAKRRGFALSEEVAKFLLNHYARDMCTQLNLLDKLDRLSLQEKRKITLAFVRSLSLT